MSGRSVVNPLSESYLIKWERLVLRYCPLEWLEIQNFK